MLSESELQRNANVIRLPVEFAPLVKELSKVEIGPLESQMREKLAKLKATRYPDSFDWGVYDRISTRYQDGQPRGGLVFKTGLRLVNHHASCSKCFYAFELDTYGRGCMHNCSYCYAKEILTRHGSWNQPQPFPLDLTEIRKVFYTVFETQKPSKWRKILEQRIPLRLGSMSDSFMWIDLKYGVTKELLKILSFYKYPHIIFTRSDLVAHDDYLEYLDRKLAAVQFSISGGNEKIARIVEPGAPGITRRLVALQKLAEHGYWTSVRINPLFPMFPDGYFTDPESVIARFGSMEEAPNFPLFDWDFIGQLKDAKVPSVLAGVVRLSPFAIRQISKEMNLDFSKFFRPEFFNKTKESKFSDPEIRYYYSRIKKECDKFKMRFSTCYIGNGIKDYFQYQSLWSNKKDCCDVRGHVSTFKSSSQDIGWSERIKFSSKVEEAQVAKLQDELADKTQQKTSLVIAKSSEEVVSHS